MNKYRLILQTPDDLGGYGGLLGLDNALSPLGVSGAAQLLDEAIGHELTCFIELDGHGSFLPGLPGTAGLAS